MQLYWAEDAVAQLFRPKEINLNEVVYVVMPQHGRAGVKHIQHIIEHYELPTVPPGLRIVTLIGTNLD